MIPIRDTAPCHSRPIVTWSLIVICSILFITMELLPDALSSRLINLYGMVPIRYSNAYFGLPFDGYLSFLTSLFLHGNWFHLLMNMWFLWIFGDNVEDRMGSIKFLFFYLICGLLATLLQWHNDPLLAVPVVGASGAISGVLAAYFFLYPLERVVIWVPVLFFPIIIHVPAIAFLGVWVLIQLHDALTSLFFGGETVDVAWWAHLGGFIAGTLLHRLFIGQTVDDGLV